VLGRHFRGDEPRRRSVKLGSAVIMGAAISGMHHTAVAGVTFLSASQASPDRWTVSASGLPQIVILATTVILGLALSTSRTSGRQLQRSRLSRRVGEARDAERRAIARSLHEDLGQILTAIRLDLQRIDARHGGEAAVADSLMLVDVALQRVRDISVELRPPVLDDLGLGPAARWLANRQAERAGYAVVVDDQLTGRFPATIEAAAFRVVREALTNIARHAHATSVRLSLEYVPGGIEVCISDNGAGFDVAAARRRAYAGSSIGVLDMEQAVTFLGGSMTTVSAPGQGTTVRARLRLVKDAG
jgi:signal transduction histidine kinase